MNETRNSSILVCVGLVFACAVLILFRLHAFDLPLETDECNYVYIGSRLLAGDRLYVNVWDHQPFGVFVLFAGVISIFGDTPVVFRWMVTAFSVASLLLVFGIVRRSVRAGTASAGGGAAAVFAAVVFALVSSDPGTAGEGANREIYMNTLILAAWYLALRSEGRRLRLILAAGVAMAVASSLKTIVAVHWPFLAAWIVTVAWRGDCRRSRVRSAATALLLFGVGPLILWLAAFAYFGATGRWEEFTGAVFTFNLSYSDSAEPFPMRFVRFFSPPRHPFLFRSAWLLWIAGAGATAFLIGRWIVRRRPADLNLVLLVLASFVAVCLPGRFWPHYYYLLVPPLVIAVSVLLGSAAADFRDMSTAHPAGTVPDSDGEQSPVRDAVSTPLRSPTPGRWRHGILIAEGVVYGLFAMAVFATEYGAYLDQPPFGITVERYNSRDFWGRAQGENVRRVTKPDDSIFVYGNDAEIYYYARRRCASRFTMITGIQSDYAGADRRRELLMSDLRRDPPRLILVLFDETPFPAWKAFLDEHYTDPIGWDFHDRTGEAIMFVVARKDAPVGEIDWNWDRSQVGGWFPGARQ